MKATKVYIMVCALCTAAIAGNLLSAVVTAAQDPTVSISLTVQNQTTNSDASEANDKESALAAKPGDILKYTATVTNKSEASQDNKNDFISAKVISALPSGLELVANAATREINEDMGTIKPGKSAAKTFTVRVTANTDDIIESKACFTGRYEAQNKPQSDCEPAFVRITAPTPPVQPTPPAETEPPVTNDEGKQPSAAAETHDKPLPTTGPSDIIAPLAALSVGSIAYTARLVSLKRRG